MSGLKFMDEGDTLCLNYPAIRVYEWVEITEALYHGSIADPAIRVYEWVEILICCY